MKSKSTVKQELISVVIPTRNAAVLLEVCLNKLRSQPYKNLEIIIVDGNSTDNAKEIALKYKAKFFNYVPRIKKGLFDAPHKINYGANKAKGKYIYWLDTDMEMTKNVLSECVDLANKGADAVIIKEESFGKGIWANAKQLERRCYWGDDTVESPRFYKKSTWKAVGGFDLSLGAGGNDWDLYQKTLEMGYKVLRTKNYILHNEGDLKLMKLIKKRFMYGREALKYVSKRPKQGLVSFFPFRKSFFTHWRMFMGRPIDTFAFIFMRLSEYTAGFLGIIFARFIS